MKVYFLPGLGFDYRIFQNLDLPDIEATYLNWIDPLNGQESIEQYAKRLSEQIEINTHPILLVGHSLGGILALEISNLLPVQKVILVSSIRSRKELPLHFKMVHPLRLDRFFTKEMSNNTLRFWGKHHDYASKEEQRLFKSMIGKQSNLYLQWALRQLSIWNPKEAFPVDIYQIHGKRDRTLPLKLVQRPDLVVESGGHFLVYRESATLSKFLNETL